MKKVLIAISLSALLLAVTLISLKAYFVLVAVVIGGLLIGYRELWSLLRTGKMPPFDERVKNNTSRSIRNGFIFFTAESVFLMLIFSLNWAWHPTLLSIIAGIFVSVGAVYFLSYLFYDRVEPYLGEKGQKLLRMFLLIAGASIAVCILSAVLHNAIGAIFGTEEAVFFIIALIVAPIGLAVGLMGSLALCITRLVSHKS